MRRTSAGNRRGEQTRRPGTASNARRHNENGADRSLGTFATGRKAWSPPKQALAPEESSVSRDRLLGEISALASEEQATAWAHQVMAAKNTLATVDCGVVEAAFAARLGELTDLSVDANSRPKVDEHSPSGVDAATTEVGAVQEPASPLPADSGDLAAQFSRPRRVNNAVAWHVDKGALALSEPRRYRDRAHLRFVSAQPCLICGRRPSDAHHLRFAQPRALGRRVSDEYTVPLCRSHHRALHRCGDEPAWWKRNGVEPIAVAGELWQRTRLDGPRGGLTEALLSVGAIEAPGSAGQ
jgi:hypothetical protein